MPDRTASVPDRVLFIQTRHIGDVVVSTALLEQLRAAHPNVSIDWLAAPDTAPMLEHHPLVSEQFALTPGRVRGTGKLLRARRYDWVIDLQGTWRTALISLRSGAPVRAGWSGLDRGWAYTHRVARAGADSTTYVVRDRARLLAALGVPLLQTEPRLYLHEAERRDGAALMDELTSGRRRAGMLITTRFPYKDWSPAAFAAVARALSDEGVQPVVFRAPGGEESEAGFATAAGGAAVFAPAVSLRQLMALIAACDVFLSADTGPAHIATALDVPRVTIHGPTPAAGWTPDSPYAVAVAPTSVQCDACAGEAPRTAHVCMTAVTPEMVLTPLRELLRNGRPQYDEAARANARGRQSG